MVNFKFKRYKLILGWSVFTLAFIVYALTVEPTVGFWDTGEYILTSSKLEVGHPPGAPLFQMLGAFFSVFASEPAQIGFEIDKPLPTPASQMDVPKPISTITRAPEGKEVDWQEVVDAEDRLYLERHYRAEFKEGENNDN